MTRLTQLLHWRSWMIVVDESSSCYVSSLSNFFLWIFYLSTSFSFINAQSLCWMTSLVALVMFWTWISFCFHPLPCWSNTLNSLTQMLLQHIFCVTLPSYRSLSFFLLISLLPHFSLNPFRILVAASSLTTSLASVLTPTLLCLSLTCFLPCFPFDSFVAPKECFQPRSLIFP